MRLVITKQSPRLVWSVFALALRDRVRQPAKQPFPQLLPQQKVAADDPPQAAVAKAQRRVRGNHRAQVFVEKLRLEVERRGRIDLQAADVGGAKLRQQLRVAKRLRQLLRLRQLAKGTDARF